MGAQKSADAIEDLVREGVLAHLGKRRRRARVDEGDPVGVAAEPRARFVGHDEVGSLSFELVSRGLLQVLGFEGEADQDRRSLRTFRAYVGKDVRVPHQLELEVAALLIFWGSCFVGR